MKGKAQFQMDANGIEKIMRDYGGNEAGHFGFIAQEDGRRHFFAGGRADIIGISISEALANFIVITPGLKDDFIDNVCMTAKDMLKMIREKQPQ